jgi:hypothetical protein
VIYQAAKKRTCDVSEKNATLRAAKSLKSPNMPQFRPLKDFLGTLETRFYGKILTGSNISDLVNWIKTSIRRYSIEIVQDMMSTTRSYWQ